MKNSYILIVLALIFANTSQAQQFHINENFNAGNLPSGWTNTAVSGTQNWKFGVDGANAHTGNQNLDGTSMAYFDDDALGGNSINNTASLMSPVFDNTLDSSTTLEFDYNFREFAGPNPPDSFYVEVYDGANWNTVFSVNTDSCGNYIQGSCVNNFPHAKIDISPFANTNCQLRFTYYDGDDWGWYVGLDNVTVTYPYPYDIQLTEIISPTTSCGLTNSESVQVNIKNNGSVSLTSPFSVKLDVDNGNQVLIDTLSIIIPAGDSVVYTFSNTIDLSTLGSHSLKGYTNYSLDQDTDNDTIITIVNSDLLAGLPYFDDFEGTNHWSTSGTNNSWNLGIPAATFIDTAASGSNAYVTNLSGNYNNDETSYLTSPCFDFSNSVGDPFVAFDMIYSIHDSYDSLIMESSIDNGISWQKVNPSSISFNFYNKNSSHWEGISSGWIRVENRLTGLGGKNKVKLRFKFETDASRTREGIGIDNVEIFSGYSTDLSLINITSPVSIVQDCGRDSGYVELELINKGITNIDTTYLFYQINGGIVESDTLIQTIFPNSQTTISSSKSFAFNFSNNLINVWCKTPRDFHASNDSVLNYFFLNKFSTSYHLPIRENFDSFKAGNVFSNGNDMFSNDWERSAHISSYSWRVADSTVANRSSGTGPTSDVTGGNFIYTEASLGNAGDTATLTSPCIQLNQNSNIILEFYSYRFGSDIGPLYVDFYNGSNWSTIDVITVKPQTSIFSPWSFHSYSLTATPYSNVRIRFRSTKQNSGFEGDIAIDDFHLYSFSDLDASVNGITSPSTQCFLSSNEIIRTNIFNNGTLDILPNTLSMSYVVNDTLTVTEIISDTVKVNTTLSYSFNQSADLSTPGVTYSIKIYSHLNGDLNIYNDTFKTEISNTMNLISYSENFENSNSSICQGSSGSFTNALLPIGWKDLSNSWLVQNSSNCTFSAGTQGATPSYATGPGGAHQGNSFLYLEPDQSSSLSSVLETSCFDFVNDSSITLEFWYHKYGAGMGNLYIEAEDMQGTSLILDSIIGQTQTSFFDSWLKKTISLDNYAGQQIRVRFRAEIITGSNPSQSDMAIDDIRIFNPLTVSLEEPKMQKAFSLYPNPNNGLFTLKVSNKTVGARYRIFDMKGSLVKSERINSPTSQIRLDEVKKGIYFIQIENLGRTEKIVIQ